jgi:hypothetical protein
MFGTNMRHVLKPKQSITIHRGSTSDYDPAADVTRIGRQSNPAEVVSRKS